MNFLKKLLITNPHDTVTSNTDPRVTSLSEYSDTHYEDYLLAMITTPPFIERKSNSKDYEIVEYTKKTISELENMALEEKVFLTKTALIAEKIAAMPVSITA